MLFFAKKVQSHERTKNHADPLYRRSSVISPHDLVERSRPVPVSGHPVPDVAGAQKQRLGEERAQKAPRTSGLLSTTGAVAATPAAGVTATGESSTRI